MMFICWKFRICNYTHKLKFKFKFSHCICVEKISTCMTLICKTHKSVFEVRSAAKSQMVSIANIIIASTLTIYLFIFLLEILRNSQHTYNQKCTLPFQCYTHLNNIKQREWKLSAFHLEMLNVSLVNCMAITFYY